MPSPAAEAGLERRLDELAGLVLDVGELQAGGLGVGEVDVADGARRSIDDLGDAGVALAGLGVGRPLDGRAALERPGAIAAGADRGVQELGEVLGRARAVGAVGDDDGLVGSLASGLSAAMAGSFQFVISRWKILAIVSGVSCSLSTPSGCTRP